MWVPVMAAVLPPEAAGGGVAAARAAGSAGQIPPPAAWPCAGCRRWHGPSTGTSRCPPSARRCGSRRWPEFCITTAYGPNGAGHQSLGQATQGAQPQDEQNRERSPEGAGHFACDRKGCPALTGLGPSVCQFQGRCPWLCCLAPSGPILLSITAQCWPARLAVSWSILSKPAQYHHGRQFSVILRPDL